MNGMYLGKLSYTDPLYEVLALRAYPDIREPVLHVNRLSEQHLVYRYTEERSRRAVVGKFFCADDPHSDRVARMKHEFANLVRLRDLGFDTRPHYVVNPLCNEWRIGLAVAEDYMAMTELRIARNTWLDCEYRRHLIREAHECLVWGLRL